MITQRSQYKFVTPPADIMIDGGIMPARDVADDGSWGDLRGEDACFLAEAAQRIGRYHLYGSPYSSTPLSGDVTDAIDRYPMSVARSIIDSYPTLSMSYGSVLYAFPGEPVLNAGYVTDVGSSVLGIIQGGFSNTGSLFSPTPSGGFNGGLKADDVRGVYYDLRMSGFHVCDNACGMRYYGSGAASHSNYRWDSDLGDYVFEASYVNQGNSSLVINVTKYHSTWGGDEYIYDWTLNAIPPKYGTGTGLAPLGGGNVECYAVFPVSVTYGPSGNTNTYHDAIVQPGVIGSDGVVEISPLTASNVRTAVNSARSIPMSFGGVPDLYKLEISVQDAYAVFYDPDIDTSDIDWQWEPPSAA